MANEYYRVGSEPDGTQKSDRWDHFPMEAEDLTQFKQPGEGSTEKESETPDTIRFSNNARNKKKPSKTVKSVGNPSNLRIMESTNSSSTGSDRTIQRKNIISVGAQPYALRKQRDKQASLSTRQRVVNSIGSLFGKPKIPKLKLTKGAAGQWQKK